MGHEDLTKVQDTGVILTVYVPIVWKQWLLLTEAAQYVKADPGTS